LMQPSREQMGQTPHLLPSTDRSADLGDFPLAAVVGLNPFERFVFVMSVLERYSDQDCKTLLGCSRQDIIWARTRALEHIANFSRTSVPDALFDTHGPVRHEASVARSA
jgi:hypothetical protein